MSRKAESSRSRAVKSRGKEVVQEWKADRYAEHAPFVPLLGQSVLNLLNLQPGERILDVGCGDGTLSAGISEVGATVVGVDGSPAFSGPWAMTPVTARPDPLQEGEKFRKSETKLLVPYNASASALPLTDVRIT